MCLLKIEVKSNPIQIEIKLAKFDNYFTSMRFSIQTSFLFLHLLYIEINKKKRK